MTERLEKIFAQYAGCPDGISGSDWRALAACCSRCGKAFDAEACRQHAKDSDEWAEELEVMERNQAFKHAAEAVQASASLTEEQRGALTQALKAGPAMSEPWVLELMQEVSAHMTTLMNNQLLSIPTSVEEGAKQHEPYQKDAALARELLQASAVQAREAGHLSVCTFARVLLHFCPVCTLYLV